MTDRIILTTGAGGQVGQALMELPPPAGWRIDGRARGALDITDPDAVGAALADGAVAAVINLAAYTAVDRAETEPDAAYRINRDGPAVLAEACVRRGIPLVHVSTDDVFDGSADRPWRETDPTGPVSVYGASKLAGEQAVAAAGVRHAILRTSWVFGAQGGNFVKTMLRVGADRDSLRVVADQIGGPTPARAIAETCLTLADRLALGADATGVFHYGGSPAVSWHGFAEAIFARAAALGWRVPRTVEAITTADYPTPARRPAYSVLDTTRLTEAYGIAAPDWRTGLDDVLARLTQKD